MFTRIANRTIYGTVLPFTPAPRELHTTRTHYAGLAGVSEIQLATGARQHQVGMVIHKRYTRTQLQQAVQKLQQGFDGAGWIGTNGRLTIHSDALEHRFDNCTFEGFLAQTGLLPDIGGTLDGGWFVEGVLLFTQLK